MSELELQAEKPGLMSTNNPVLVQLLGLSPLLAVSSSLVYGIGLGIATLLVCILSCVTTSLLASQFSHKWRLVWFMLILASFTTLAETISALYFYPLFVNLGIYIPLICCNISILIRMELVSSKSKWTEALPDSLKTGLGFLIALLLFSGCRELLINGTVLANWQLLLPTNGELSLVGSGQSGANYFRFADTQAGAFIVLGLLIALINKTRNSTGNKTADEANAVIPARRARVTGRLIKNDSKD
jgi:electron transport complex protein RnfE